MLSDFKQTDFSLSSIVFQELSGLFIERTVITVQVSQQNATFSVAEPRHKKCSVSNQVERNVYSSTRSRQCKTFFSRKKKCSPSMKRNDTSFLLDSCNNDVLRISLTNSKSSITRNMYSNAWPQIGESISSSDADTWWIYLPNYSGYFDIPMFPMILKKNYGLM
jgi:hypothetical protein